MTEPLKLMCVLAHPDDESLGTGGLLASYAAEGVETYLVTATRGERGWAGEPDEYPGPEALGRLREAELRAAAEILGIRQLFFLDYIDGELDQADVRDAVTRIAHLLRRVRPQVVVTFAPDGGYGHPDHIAISQFTTAAIVAAASTDAGDEVASHQVSKLYYFVVSPALAEAYAAAMGDIAIEVDGVLRRGVAWPEWAITTRLDTTAHWRTVWRAVSCHRSQLPNFHALEQMAEEAHEGLWGNQSHYRAFSRVNGGRVVEHDLFVGLR